jgi:hypothetical protein
MAFESKEILTLLGGNVVGGGVGQLITEAMATSKAVQSAVIGTPAMAYADDLLKTGVGALVSLGANRIGGITGLFTIATGLGLISNAGSGMVHGLLNPQKPIVKP